MTEDAGNMWDEVPDGADLPLAALRSLLFVPADDGDRAERAFERGADGVILDLEDGVAAKSKDTARTVAAGLARSRPSGSALLVRVNALDSPWGNDDLKALSGLSVDALVVPKATPASVRAWGGLGLPLLALVETAAGLREAYQTACDPLVHALMLGGADLGAELRLRSRPDGLELLHARSALVVDSAAAGIRAPFDVVQLVLDDAEGLEREAELAKALGFGGKPCIHPSQIGVVNRVFSPSPDELAEAQEIVRAYEDARRAGKGALAVQGRMVDMPIVLQARGTLARGGFAIEATGEGT